MSRHYGWVIVGAGAIISCVAAALALAFPPAAPIHEGEPVPA